MNKEKEVEIEKQSIKEEENVIKKIIIIIFTLSQLSA